jgi:hypothetical protein
MACATRSTRAVVAGKLVEGKREGSEPMRKRCTLRGLACWLTWGLIGAALYDQLRRPPQERTWTGRIGPIPYDFRPPSLERMRASFWNPEDARLFTPMPWGIGWSVNLAVLGEQLRPALERLRTRVRRAAPRG